jgi:methionine synthase II (cobalamin-independent)
MPVVHPAFQAAVEPHFEKALVRASRNIQSAIPHDRLAIQIDLALEFAWTPQSRVDYIGEPKLERLIQRAVTMAESVENDVELGFHLCYGASPEPSHITPACVFC